MTRRKTKYERAVDAAESFNKKHREGTPVLFWPGVRPDSPQKSTTRGSAWALPDGDPVVRVHGRPGGIALSHIEVIHPIKESEVLS